jgi:7-cyano-7-deazaguanine synthase
MPTISRRHRLIGQALRLPGVAAAERSIALVLLSGGLDSSALLALAQAQGLNVSALHVDYGQPPAVAERAAAEALSAWAGVPCRTVTYRGSAFGPGEVRGRNALLLQIGLIEFPAREGLVLIGIHSGTEYRDCTPGFVEMMQRLYDFHSDGLVSVSAPFLDLRKGDVARLALDFEVPIELSHSCEASDQPCGVCQSCRDRVAVTQGAGAGVRP